MSKDINKYVINGKMVKAKNKKAAVALLSDDDDFDNIQELSSGQTTCESGAEGCGGDIWATSFTYCPKCGNKLPELTKE